MGLLIDGVWQHKPRENPLNGRFVRGESVFRNWITPDGRPGPTGQNGYAAQPGRYHLYVSLACPWAHRTLILRTLKGLDTLIPISVTHWLMRENGWTFAAGEGVIPDPLFGAQFLHEIYSNADGQYTGRATVPVLWDKHTQTIVNNGSSEIVCMLNSAFDSVGAKPGDYYPGNLRADIDALNAQVEDTVNNGVYKAGFATTQENYEDAVRPMFDMLDVLEERLSQGRFLFGDTLTLADIRLFPTLVRFDLVYHGQFKCNIRRLVDYRNLWAYTRDIYQLPGIADTVNRQHIQRHYYMSYLGINPTGITPVGPALDFDVPADRGKDIARILVF